MTAQSTLDFLLDHACDCTFAMMPPLKTAVICLADHALPRLPVFRHDGPAGSMVVAGTEAWSRYLSDRFFAEGPRTTKRLGAWPVWRLHGILEQWRRQTDIVVARIDRLSAGRFPQQSYLRVPEWVRMVAPVPSRDGRFSSSQARRNARLVNQQGLTWRVSHDPRDLSIFVERDYLVYTRARYGDDAHVRPWPWFQSRFRRGGIVWIMRESEPVAGMLYDVQRRSLRRLAVACVHGDPSLLKTGAMSATYLACFDLARSLGCEEIDFRNCRPSLTDGLLQVKRSWGGLIAPADDLTHDWLVGWREASPSVLRFLADSPLIVREGGRFAAVGAAPVGMRSVCASVGIDRFFTVTPHWQFGSENPVASCVIVDAHRVKSNRLPPAR